MDDDGLWRVEASDGWILGYELGGGHDPGQTGSTAAESTPERTDGPPVVFLHGTLANRFAFRKVRPMVEATGRATVLTVLRAHGDGDDRVLPDDYGLATTEVADLLAVLDTEGLTGPVDLFAHSTGGSIAVALAARHPERVRRMVLVEPTLLPLLDGPMADRIGVDVEAMTAAAVRGDHLEALRILLDFIGGTTWHASGADAHRKVIDNLAPLAPLTGPHARALADLAVTAADVATLAAPALLVYGRESAYFESSIAATLGHLRPDLPQLHVDGCGHNSHLERPDLVGPAAVDFLCR